jgi:hypothetical protein
MVAATRLTGADVGAMMLDSQWIPTDGSE